MNLLTHRSSTAIALCLLGGSAISAPTAFAAPIDTYPGFLSADEVEHFASSVDVDKEGIWREANKGRDATTLDPAIFERLLDVTGTRLTAEEQFPRCRTIPVTKITGTTERHVDHHYSDDSFGTELVEGKSAFVFLHSNPHAKFVHGSTEIHAKAGDLVVFDANVPHNTQVARGTLSLVGPVALRRFTPVGGPTPPTPAPKGSKGAKSPKAPKSSKGSKGSKGGGSCTGCCGNSGGRRMQDMGDGRSTLQYMTDRFKEEGSVRSFVDSFGYEVDLKSGTGEKENVLTKEDCEGLMSLIEHGSNSNVDGSAFLDIRQFVDESDVVSIIGKDKFNILLDLHKEVVGATVPLEFIRIRHMSGAANSDVFIEYHTDESGNHGPKMSTVEVALNDNSSVKGGGDLYYLREDGPVPASRSQGKAFAHSYNVVYGVTPHVGERVVLNLHFNHDLKLEDVGGRKLTEEYKREFGQERYEL